MNYGKLLSVSLLLTSLVGCAPQYYTKECVWAKEILPDRNVDIISRPTKEQIAYHNIEYRKHCAKKIPNL
jgi:hypothetical protein